MKSMRRAHLERGPDGVLPQLLAQHDESVLTGHSQHGLPQLACEGWQQELCECVGKDTQPELVPGLRDREGR